MIIVKHYIVFHDSSSAAQEIILFFEKCQVIMSRFLFRRGKGEGKVGEETEEGRKGGRQAGRKTSISIQRTSAVLM